MREIQGKSVFDSLEEVIDPTHTCLLVIDMQNDFVHDDGAYARRGDDPRPAQRVVAPIAELIRAARTSGALVVYTQNTTLPGGLSDAPAWLYFKNFARPELGGQYTLEGTWGQEILAELAPTARDVVVKKHRSDAFVATDLDLVLRSNLIKTVVTVGIVTNGCVESTARHASFLDYYSVVVEDACASSSQRLHEAALDLLRGRQDVVPASTVLERWGAL